MNSYLEEITYLCISGLLTWFFLKISIKFLQNYVLDYPTSRSSHKFPKPTSGGVSFILGIIIICTFQKIYLPLYAVPLAIVGFLDDKWGVKPNLRLATQIVTVSLYFYIYLFTTLQTNLNNPFYLALVSFFLIFCGTAIINFINFMDGIDGLVSSCLAVLFFVYSIKSGFSYLPFCSALFIFSFWNWQPSKIFMGDVGSTFLGAMITGMLFSSNNVILSLETILVCTPLMMDACWAIIRRKLNKENIVKPHKKHLFQRLTLNGFSHKKTTSIYLLGTLIISIPFLFSDLLTIFITACFVGLVGIYIDKKYAFPFNKL